MKRFLICVFFLATLTLGYGQGDAAAKKLLNEVSQKYDGYKTLQSDFVLTVKTSDEQTYVNPGTMVFNKPKKQYRISLQDEDIISDGRSLWNISNEIKEIQITAAENNASTIGPDNLFSFYKNGYRYSSLPDEKITKDNKTESVKVVELSPIDQNNNYAKIKLRINSNQHIHDVTIFDKSNNRYTYLINTLYVNHRISSKNFEFRKENYKGFSVVDLR